MSPRSPRMLLPFVVAAYLALLAPLVVVIAVSFGPSAVFEFPPHGVTLHWFEAFFASPAFVTAFFRVSLVVGLLAAALATVLGTSAALGLVRFRFFGREAVETFFLAPLLVPEILLGAALYLFYARLAVQASIWTLLCGHLVICTPYVIRSVTAGLVGLDPRLEEAAMSLGATRVQAFFKVTLPLLRSSLVSGAIFAFIISFSDINLALFLSGPQSTSLPVHIFSQIQWQGDPTIAAASSMQMLMGADEEGTLERLKGARRQLFDPKIKEHRGRIVKTTGDGILAEFPSVVDAVRCAVELQRGMVDRNAQPPEDERIIFRIGINLGDIIGDGDDIYGDGVNIAARLEALAQPGGICISRVVRDQIRDKLPYPFEDLGEQNVKNIARPVRAYGMSAIAVASTPPFATKMPPHPALRAIRRQRAFMLVAIIAAICVGATGWWLWPSADPIAASVQTFPATTPRDLPSVPSNGAKPASRLSIVVLPFANLSNDSAQEYFADAITEDLTTDLSRISGSFVIAATTAFTYKGKGFGAKQIGRELGVYYVLEGSVQRRSDHAEVNVQLIDTESGAHLWADRFESDLANLANAQNEITGRLARTLNVELAEAVGRRVEREGSVNSDAQDFLMRGWASYYRPASIASRQEALRAFERALEADSQSVAARIGIGTVLVDDLVLRFTNDRERDTARADEMLRDVLEREMNDSMAHFAMGMLRRIQNRLNDSQIELEAAIALDRNNARAFQQLGITLMCLGEPELAIPQIERAIRLNPHDPNIASYYWALGSAELVSGRVDDAVNVLSKGRAANPRLYFIDLWLAGSLALKGDLDAARSAVAESMKLRPEINSVASWRAENLFYTNPRFTALAEKTLYAGLRRAGFLDE